MVLKEMALTRGVSGDEGCIRRFILEKIGDLADDVRVDRIGNILATRRARQKPNGRHALIGAHMDEVGLIVTGINDNGLLSYEPVGGIDSRVVVSKRVRVGENALPGVIGAKAIHLQSAEERTQVLKHDKLFIDIGAKDKAAAEKLVSPGDYASFDSQWVEFGDGLVKCKALDDRVGCMTLLSALEGDYPCDLTCAFTVQEEIGLRGARVAGHQVDVDCAIALEGTTANDLGDVPEALRVCDVGKGVAISFMDNSSIAHPGLTHALRSLAEAHGIPWQVKRFVAGGNDAGAFQTARGAVPTAVLSVPCRYIHSPSSVASFKDIEAQYRLVDAFLQNGATF